MLNNINLHHFEISSVKDMHILISDVIEDNNTFNKIGNTVKTNSLYDYEGFRMNKDCELKPSTIAELKILKEQLKVTYDKLYAFIDMLADGNENNFCKKCKKEDKR